MSTLVTKNVQVGNSATASQNFTIYQPSTPDGTVRIGVGNSGATTADVLSISAAGLSAAGLTGDIAAARITNALNASGSAPIYAARAWVNFNGTGTVAIRSSGNVSSITDNGTGDYTVNFATALSDANYCVCGTAGGADTAGDEFIIFPPAGNVVAGNCKVRVSAGSGSATDVAYAAVAIFR
ncbi:MAG: hypothetical protein ACKOW0_00810 [Schleiferiaceae bacterium]